MKKVFFILTVLLSIQFGYAQVGINTTTPDAQLQIKSSNQATPANNDGILIPKIDAFPLTNPTAAQNSMMVYLNVDLPGKPKGFYYWDNASTSWKPISSSNWTLTGANLANNNTGNVGVGTGVAIPSSLLTVKKDGIGFTQEDVTGVSKIGFFTVASDAWIQTHSNSDLKFATNNGATQMTLQKGTGNLGINILSPTEKLEVAGKTKTTDLQVTTGAGAGKVLTSDAVGNATWQNSAAGTGWLTLGNAGTNATTNFIGTTDNNDLVFKRFNIRAGLIGNTITSFGNQALNPLSTGLNNNAFGNNSLSLNTVGYDNCAYGNQALQKNIDGRENVAVGNNALQNSEIAIQNTAVGMNALKSLIGGGDDSGSFNVAVGYNALTKNEYGTFNTAIGSYSLEENVTGAGNVALGNYALNNTTAHNNIAIGTSSMQYNNAGSRGIGIGTNALANFGNTTTPFTNQNIAIGYESLKGSVIFANNTGNSNLGVGYQSLFSISSGNDNVANGFHSLYSNTVGSNNIAMGSNTLYANTSGNFNIAIGNSSLITNTTGSGNTAIGELSLEKNTIGGDNTATGYYALRNNTVGINNIANGVFALLTNTTGNNNTATGKSALYSNTTGNNNTANGRSALFYNSTGVNNVAVGFEALRGSTNPANNSGGLNTAIGYQSLFENSSGSNNLANGFHSLYSNTIGSYNIAMGSNSLYTNTSGNFNIAIGNSSLYTNTTGSENTAIGQFSLEKNTIGGDNTATGFYALRENTLGIKNTANGKSALYYNTIGNYNTATGMSALFFNTTGVNNVAVGFESLNNNSTGNANIAIGNQAGFSETGSNKLYIENSNSATPLIYGDFATDLLRFNGNLEVDNLVSANNKMQLVNKNNFVHGIGNQIFGNGGDDFIISSKEGATETAGVYGDGNAVTIWSAGDANQGQAAALVYFLDEDNFDVSNTNPYDASSLTALVALKSYITPAGAYFQVSDKNKKENIQKIENATDKINQISGYTYQFKLATTEIEKGDKPIKSSGVLAQEVEKILPEAVQKNANGDYFVDYAAITPLLIEAIKDQNAKIKSLETANSEILKRLEKLENK